MLEEGKALGNIVYNQDGTMPFETFVATQKIVTKYILRYSKQGVEEDKVKRREFAAGDKDMEYRRIVQETAMWQEKTNEFMKRELYLGLKVPKDVLEKSGKTYL